MPRTLPPLTWFRTFEAAARTLSFTAAAEEIGMTQSAVSQQVKSLELRLGAALFVRKPRSLALTDEGRKLLPQVSASLRQLEQATEPFDRGAGASVLTVATSVSVAQWLISPRLAAFRAAHPEVQLRLVSAVWPDDFHASQADVEIRFGTAAQAGKDAMPLKPSGLVAVKSPRLAGRPETWPLIEAVGTSGGWKAWHAAHGGRAAPALFADTYGLAMQLAADGNGVALVSELLARHAVERGVLEIAYEGAIEAAEGYYVSCKDRLPAADDFTRWLVGALSATET